MIPKIEQGGELRAGGAPRVRQKRLTQHRDSVPH